MNERAPASPPVLDYAPIETVSASRTWRWVVAGLFFPGLAVPFLPFAYDLSAAYVIRQELADFSFPGDYLPLLVLALGVASPAAMFGWLVRVAMRPPGKAERRIVMGVVLALMACTLYFVLKAFEMQARSPDDEWWFVVPALLILWVTLPLGLRERPACNQTAGGLIWMHGGYVGNVSLALIGFRASAGIAWFVTLWLVLVSITDVIVTSRRA